MKSELPKETCRKRGLWQTCRLYIRRFRITIWLLILALLGVLLYLTQIGLPDFAKKPLLENLRARGLDLQFSRLRLNWQHGIVAENVRFGRADEPFSPHLMVDLIQVRLNHEALAHLKVQVDSVVLRRGRLVWPLEETNQAPRQLALENIQTELRFLPDDEWALDQFTATMAGAKLQLSGTLAHASALRDWQMLKTEQATPAGAWRDRLRQLADIVEHFRFSAPPELKLVVRGDALDLTSFDVRVSLNTPGAETPWGILQQGRFSARLLPATTNGWSRAELSLEAAAARTRWATTLNMRLAADVTSFESLTNLGAGNLTLRAKHIETEWGNATNVQLVIHGVSAPGETNLVNANLALSAGSVESKWGSVTNAQINAQWVHALTNAIPLSGEGQLHGQQISTHWGTAKEFQLDVHLAAPLPFTVPHADESWAWWAKLEPYGLDWKGRISEARSHGLEVEDIVGGGSWRAPQLTITNLQAQLDKRLLNIRADLNVATRALGLNFASDVDPHTVSPALSESAQGLLAALTWEQPPKLKGDVSLVLPAWTNRQPDWPAEVQPTLRFQGEVKLDRGGAYRGVTISAAQSHISYSNLVLRLPDLTVVRPEGKLEAVHESDDRTKEFYSRISSKLDVMFLRPLLDQSLQRAFDLITLPEPPVISMEIRGCTRELKRIGIKGRVALTNFTFRGESASSLQAALEYTNGFLQITQPRVQRGAQQLKADAVGVDFAAQKIYLTNGFSTAEPMVVARAIGPNIAHIVEPYHFAQPPVAHVYGTIPMHGEAAADLHFDLDGGPFDWWRVHVPRIVGQVHWRGQQLTLTNIWMDFYGGQAVGSARFDFSPRNQTDYQFNLTTTNALLQPLVKDLFAATNRLEGRLWATLEITNANTINLQSWYGRGELNLRDGLIWEIPVFGLFSDVLNGVAPGLGSSRASAGACTFIITNGIIRSDDLDIRSTGMRLQYRGTLDFQGQVNARVEAGLLRNMWLVGPILSTVLWPVTKLFEYKVTGSLGDPKAEPVTPLPKVMLFPLQFPFHPLRTLRGLLPEDIGSSPTNAPSLTSPKQQ